MKSKITSEDTIAAIATPPGEGGIGVVRLSGEAALKIADRIFIARSGGSTTSQKNFTVRYGHIVEKSPEGEKVVDEVLCLVMRGPKSYTGEDTVEISAHGGPSVLQAIMRLAMHAGARAAEPGEFTKRAFLNGRLDLIQAEAVLDLIHARTERERIWAMAQLEGALSAQLKKWKAKLVDSASHLEAAIDFPEDLPDTDSLTRNGQKIGAVSAEIKKALLDAELVLTAKRGFRIALWGRPNVGKSSLMNRLTRSERVIVTPYPGTTRDMVEEMGVLGGFAVRYQDTAGVRETDHPIEKEGVERSKKAAQSADLVLLVLDSSEPLKADDRALFSQIVQKQILVVLNKSDLPRKLDAAVLGKELPPGAKIVRSSCLEPSGMEELEKAMLGLILGGALEIPQGALISTARQRDLLEKVSKELESASDS